MSSGSANARWGSGLSNMQSQRALNPVKTKRISAKLQRDTVAIARQAVSREIERGGWLISRKEVYGRS